ncbi:hypothetical protein TNCT_63681 [Trichonephila clavata]|uniref:Uncharacterized protein n=1 Tax=Trichonephila clavata TaxID=2740835 RepID=A0A8X6LYG3_TRICU|nr:hypothetical protein TNCT_63681 [Trichonephila clavata]
MDQVMSHSKTLPLQITKEPYHQATRDVFYNRDVHHYSLKHLRRSAAFLNFVRNKDIKRSSLKMMSAAATEGQLIARPIIETRKCLSYSKQRHTTLEIFIL